MKRIAALALFALFSDMSMGQMMGAPMATTQYFPLVDGARYDYLHSGGPWATSTSVMRVGQTWAERSGMTAMHTTY